MPSGQDVRFIRRHGRIIPIRLNREKAPRKRAAGLIGAGAAVAGGSAAISAGLVVNANKVAKRSAKMLARVNKVFKMDSIAQGISPSSVNRGLKTGLKGYKSVKTQLGISKAVLRGGVGLGTGLMAAGMMRAISQKDRPGSEGTVGAIAGIGAWALSNKIFRTIVKRKIAIP